MLNLNHHVCRDGKKEVSSKPVFSPGGALQVISECVT